MKFIPRNAYHCSRAGNLKKNKIDSIRRSSFRRGGRVRRAGARMRWTRRLFSRSVSQEDVHPTFLDAFFPVQQSTAAREGELGAYIYPTSSSEFNKPRTRRKSWGQSSTGGLCVYIYIYAQAGELAAGEMKTKLCRLRWFVAHGRRSTSIQPSQAQALGFIFRPKLGTRSHFGIPSLTRLSLQFPCIEFVTFQFFIQYM